MSADPAIMTGRAASLLRAVNSDINRDLAVQSGHGNILSRRIAGWLADYDAQFTPERAEASR